MVTLPGDTQIMVIGGENDGDHFYIPPDHRYETIYCVDSNIQHSNSQMEQGSQFEHGSLFRGMCSLQGGSSKFVFSPKTLEYFRNIEKLDLSQRRNRWESLPTKSELHVGRADFPAVSTPSGVYVLG